MDHNQNTIVLTNYKIALVKGSSFKINNDTELDLWGSIRIKSIIKLIRILSAQNSYKNFDYGLSILLSWSPLHFIDIMINLSENVVSRMQKPVIISKKWNLCLEMFQDLYIQILSCLTVTYCIKNNTI